MTAEQILRAARSDLDDKVEPYLWEDLDLQRYLARAIYDVCFEGLAIKDSSTPSTCEIDIFANQGLYSLAPSVFQIESMKLSGRSTPLEKRLESWMDRHYQTWKTITAPDSSGVIIFVPGMERGSTHKLRIYPMVYDDTGYIAGASDISFSAAGKTITKAGATFTSHFEVGDTINISGTASNNIDVTATVVADTQITVSETLVNENNTSAVLRRKEDTASLTVYRYPVSEITLHDLSVEPEIEPALHHALVDGIMAYAYEKDDADTYNQGKADRARMRFDKQIHRMKRSSIRRSHAPGSLDWHRGTT